MTLDVHASLLARLDEPVGSGAEDSAEDEDEVESAGGLTLAIDLNDAGDGTEAPAAPASAS